MMTPERARAVSGILDRADRYTRIEAASGQDLLQLIREAESVDPMFDRELVAVLLTRDVWEALTND